MNALVTDTQSIVLQIIALSLQTLNDKSYDGEIIRGGENSSIKTELPKINKVFKGINSSDSYNNTIKMIDMVSIQFVSSIDVGLLSNDLAENELVINRIVLSITGRLDIYCHLFGSSILICKTNKEIHVTYE